MTTEQERVAEFDRRFTPVLLGTRFDGGGGVGAVLYLNGHFYKMRGELAFPHFGDDARIMPPSQGSRAANQLQMRFAELNAANEGRTYLLVSVRTELSLLGNLLDGKALGFGEQLRRHLDRCCLSSSELDVSYYEALKAFTLLWRDLEAIVNA